jgi:hypothetical protein
LKSLKFFGFLLFLLLPTLLLAQDEGFSRPQGIRLINPDENPEIFTDDTLSTIDSFRSEPFAPDSFQEKWNRTRDKIQKGQPLRQEIFTFEEVPVIQTSTEPPKSLPPSFLIPKYNTMLSFTGRKVMGFSYNGKQYLHEQTTTSRAQSIKALEMIQEMQLKMHGQLGPRLAVNIDYDDTREDEQDISIIYSGQDDELVQSAQFGDIDLSLPSTEFISYDKKLFGIRLDMKYKKAKATFIGSKTKGITKRKQFFGNSQFQAKDILDTSYVRRMYYDLSFGDQSRLPIKAGSEQIYLDNQTILTANNIDTFEMTAGDMGTPAVSYNGIFRLLKPGIDYTIDYNKGVLTFRLPLSSKDVVAVNFTNADGTELKNSSPAGLIKLVKTKDDLYLSEATKTLELGYKAELKTYYHLGVTQIIRDNGRGNFTLKLQDLNRTDVGGTLNPTQKYPNDIDVDFERGIFNLKNPFGKTTDPTQPDPDIYAPSPVSKYIFRVEYHSRIKTFSLEPNIVLQSDHVTLDGSALIRNKDYYIDYETGFITFYNEDRIQPNSIIDVTYDVSPLGGMGVSSLLGSRVSVDINDHVKVGGTFLYESSSRGQTAPDISSLAESLNVMETDLTLKDIQITPSLNSNWQFEIARSKNNPNLNGLAIVDNMEGIKEKDTVSLDYMDWQIASNPTTSSADPRAITWGTNQEKTLDILPGAQATSDDEQDVLTISYDFSISPEVSIVFPFGDNGLDFSNKSVLEAIVYGDASVANPGPQVNIHLGQINEDSDGSGGVTLTCANGTILTGAPKTEDINCDGQIGPNEDKGWTYAPPALYSAIYGANNGRLDTQDLDHNGKLDAADFSGGDFGYVNSTTFQDNTDSTQRDRIDYTGWHVLQAPISIPINDAFKWSAIKQLRISLKQVPGGKTSGVIKIAKLAVVGNTWRVNDTPSNASLNVVAVNNEDNPSYQPIFSYGGVATQVYDDLYGSASEQLENSKVKNLSEQSLALQYDSTGASEVSAQRRFTKSVNLSTHKELRFLVSNPPGNEVTSNTVFFMRVGSATRYKEIAFPIDFTGWRLYTITQLDTNDDGILDTWQNSSPYSATITSVGEINLSQVNQIIAGVKVIDSNAHSGEIWFNELHVRVPNSLIGIAKKAQVDFDLDQWGTFGAKYRYMDRNFHTPITVVTNQDNEQDTAYIKLRKLSYLPIDIDYSRQITNTPNTLDESNNNLVNLLQQGVVKNNKGSISGTFKKDDLPIIGMGYSFDSTKYDFLSRKDNTQIYTTTLDYNVPLEKSYIPTTIHTNFTYTDNEVNFSDEQQLKTLDTYNSSEQEMKYAIRLNFEPWENSSFAPNFSRTQVKESRTQYEGDSLNSSSYDKSMEQITGFTSRVEIAPWFVPHFNYSMTSIENYNLSKSTVTIGQTSEIFDIGQIKSLNRTASGGINLNLNAAEIFPEAKLLRSMAVFSSYQLLDGDSWQNVNKNFDSSTTLWLRKAKKPTNSLASRSNLTLRDTYSSTQKWKPFEAFDFDDRLSIVKTLFISNNFTKQIQRSETTGTESKTINTTLPDAIISFAKLENLFGAQNWMSSSIMNLKYSRRTLETIGVTLDTEENYGGDLRFMIKSWIDNAFSYSERKTKTKDLKVDAISKTSLERNLSAQTSLNVKKFRFTPKFTYGFEKNVSLNLQGKETLEKQTSTYKPSLLIRGDFSLPQGLKLPLFKNPLNFTNRIIWTTNTNVTMKRSPIQIMENSNMFNFDTTADCEISKNIRVAIHGGFQRLWHLYLEQEDYISYQAGTTLTLQF